MNASQIHYSTRGSNSCISHITSGIHIYPDCSRKDRISNAIEVPTSCIAELMDSGQAVMNLAVLCSQPQTAEDRSVLHKLASSWRGPDVSSEYSEWYFGRCRT